MPILLHFLSCSSITMGEKQGSAFKVGSHLSLKSSQRLKTSCLGTQKTWPSSIKQSTFFVDYQNGYTRF